MFKGAIFDLDGIIVDTVPLHFEAWKKMFAEYGIEFSFDDYKAKVDGIPRLDGAKAILTSLNGEEIEAAGSRKQEYFLEFIETTDIPVYQSTVKLIKALKSHNKKIAIASSSRNCRRILEKTRLIDLADTVVPGGDFTRGKPDPEIFLLSAERLGLAYDECVVFEDAVLGVDAALNGGMVCVGVDRYNNPARLAAANLVVKDLGEVDYLKIEELFNK